MPNVKQKKLTRSCNLNVREADVKQSASPALTQNLQCSPYAPEWKHLFKDPSHEWVLEGALRMYINYEGILCRVHIM